MIVTRRALLRSTALVPVAVALAGCAGLRAAIALAPTLAQDAGLIAQAFTVIEPLLGFAGGAKNTVNNLVNLVSATAAKLASAATTTAPALVTVLGGAMGDLAGLVSGMPGVPGLVNSAIAAGLALLPEFEAAVGITPPAARRFAAMAKTPEEARADLQRIIAGG